eukprot:8523621-Pyramimonas_sp.AAC.1
MRARAPCHTAAVPRSARSTRALVGTGLERSSRIVPNPRRCPVKERPPQGKGWGWGVGVIQDASPSWLPSHDASPI